MGCIQCRVLVWIHTCKLFGNTWYVRWFGKSQVTQNVWRCWALAPVFPHTWCCLRDSWLVWPELLHLRETVSPESSWGHPLQASLSPGLLGHLAPQGKRSSLSPCLCCSLASLRNTSVHFGILSPFPCPGFSLQHPRDNSPPSLCFSGEFPSCPSTTWRLHTGVAKPVCLHPCSWGGLRGVPLPCSWALLWLPHFRGAHPPCSPSTHWVKAPGKRSRRYPLICQCGPAITLRLRDPEKQTLKCHLDILQRHLLWSFVPGIEPQIYNLGNVLGATGLHSTDSNRWISVLKTVLRFANSKNNNHINHNDNDNYWCWCSVCYAHRARQPALHTWIQLTRKTPWKA